MPHPPPSENLSPIRQAVLREQEEDEAKMPDIPSTFINSFDDNKLQKVLDDGEEGIDRQSINTNLDSRLGDGSDRDEDELLYPITDSPMNEEETYYPVNILKTEFYEKVIN
jgi:hypothetical protein